MTGGAGFDFGNFEDIVGDIFGDLGDAFGFGGFAAKDRAEAWSELTVRFGDFS